MVEKRGQESWKGEFYVSFGEGETRRWSDAREHGYIAAGGGGNRVPITEVAKSLRSPRRSFAISFSRGRVHSLCLSLLQLHKWTTKKAPI